MALPSGVVTATLTYGAAKTFTGADVQMRITVTPSQHVVWSATGQPLIAFSEPMTAADTGTITLPIVDQAGFVDVAGAPVTMWSYTISIVYVLSSTTNTVTKVVQPVTGQTTIDLDLIPSGSAAAAVLGVVPAVTSVYGRTGAITQLFTDRGAVAASTTYSPGDVFSYRGKRVLASQSITGLTGTAPFVSASKYVMVGDSADAVIPAEPFGVTPSGLDSDATTNSTALQRACDYAAALGGGIVQLPIGNTRFNGGLTLGQGVYLCGTGRLGSILQAAFNSNYDWLVANKVAADSSGQNAMLCGLMNLALDGRKDNQTSGNGYGVYLRTNPIGTAATGDSFFDPQCVLFNVRVYKSKGDGFHFIGRSALQGNLLMAQQCGGWGYWSTFDVNLGYSESDQCGLGGFHFDNGSIRTAVLKAFLSGSFIAASEAPGFYFGSNCASFAGSSLEAQNNTGPGYYLDHCKAVNLHANAESNWKDPMTAAAGPQGAGFVLDGATNCLLTVTSTQGRQGGVKIGNQLNAVRLTGSANLNDIRVVHIGILGETVSDVLTSDSTKLSNLIVGNGATL